MCDFQQVRQIWIAGAPQLIPVAFGRDFISAANHPGIFRRAILAELFEQLFEARVELPLGAVTVEVQRQIARRRHQRGWWLPLTLIVAQPDLAEVGQLASFR